MTRRRWMPLLPWCRPTPLRQMPRLPRLRLLPGGGFLLQAGSFRRQADADRLKGNLALRGLEARVESAAVGGQTVYRVRIGPYGSLDQVNQIRRELADDGIEAAAVRMR